MKIIHPKNNISNSVFHYKLLLLLSVLLGMFFLVSACDDGKYIPVKGSVDIKKEGKYISQEYIIQRRLLTNEYIKKHEKDIEKTVLEYFRLDDEWQLLMSKNDKKSDEALKNKKKLRARVGFESVPNHLFFRWALCFGRTIKEIGLKDDTTVKIEVACNCKGQLDLLKKQYHPKGELNYYSNISSSREIHLVNDDHEWKVIYDQFDGWYFRPEFILSWLDAFGKRTHPVYKVIEQESAIAY